jgi:hypothetical protein
MSPSPRNPILAILASVEHRLEIVPEAVEQASQLVFVPTLLIPAFRMRAAFHGVSSRELSGQRRMRSRERLRRSQTASQ